MPALARMLARGGRGCCGKLIGGAFAGLQEAAALQEEEEMKVKRARVERDVVKAALAKLLPQQ